MKALPALLFALVCLAGSPVRACLPPPPGYVEPSQEEKLKGFVAGNSEIVYGVVTRDTSSSEPLRLKVLHVYRGGLTKGATIGVQPGWGPYPPFCAGMIEAGWIRSAWAR